MNKTSFLKVFRWKLILPAFLLTVFGLVSLYSISSGEGLLRFKKQLIFLLICALVVFAFRFLDLRFLKSNSYLIFFLYILSLVALGALFIFGEKIRGIVGWYDLGLFSFNPVPFASLVLIFVLSKFFSSRHVETNRFKPIFLSALYVVLPFLLVFFQPDLGSAMLLILIWVGIILFSGIKLKHFIALTLVFLILVGLGWQFFLKDYQKTRVLSFLGEKANPQGSSWNINQSKIAIGSGGLLGKGLMKGSQVQGGFLPEAATDFIFAAIAEEMGLLGVFLLLGLVGFLFYQIVKIALEARYNFTRLFAAGFGFLFLFQVAINVGMNLGVVPVVGIPLPFVSYGGSTLLAFYVGIGILEGLDKS